MRDCGHIEDNQNVVKNLSSYFLSLMHPPTGFILIALLLWPEMAEITQRNRFQIVKIYL